MNKIGRPKEGKFEDNPKQFTREYTREDGRISIWTYNLDKSLNGPISVETKYPSGYKCDADIEENLPISKRTFFNPETETFVGYSRAKQLGLI